MVGIKSVHNRYLQANSNGEMHASNDHRNEEETWYLIDVDKINHIYGLQNWKNGQFVSKKLGICAPADATSLGVNETWVLISGYAFGMGKSIALKSNFDGKFLGTEMQGTDCICGGEVSAGETTGPEPRNDWAGWWNFEPVETPIPGSNPWNTIGNAFHDILIAAGPVVIDALLTAISS